MVFKRVKIAVTVKQRVTIFKAECGNQSISGAVGLVPGPTRQHAGWTLPENNQSRQWNPRWLQARDLFLHAAQAGLIQITFPLYFPAKLTNCCLCAGLHK